MSHASITTWGVAAQQSSQAVQKIVLTQLWESLPEEARRRIMKTLSRIVTQQLQISTSKAEVTHEDC